MHDEEPESSELDSAPGFDGVLEALAAAPRPRVGNHLGVHLPEQLAEAFLNEPSAEPPRTPRTGDVIEERYRIDGILGAGGMGVVFAANHLATGRKVALKWLQLSSMYRTESEREAALKRFVREAKAAGRIRHPNVVDVYDAGTSPKAPFLVMERLEGESLRARIDRGALSWDEALSVFVPAMDGVAEAHRQGVVHRDLKPDNIFLAQGADGDVCPKVLDFGVSRLHQLDDEPQASLTRTGTTLGTPAYMPLEQLRAVGDVDARTDVYALGVMLYEMLTQKRPFVARNAADFAALMASQGPTLLSRYRPDLRGARERCVMKALERDPADRHQSVAEFAAALLPSKRRSRPPIIALAVAALVLTLGIGSWMDSLGTRAATTKNASTLSRLAVKSKPALAAPTSAPESAVPLVSPPAEVIVLDAHQSPKGARPSRTPEALAKPAERKARVAGVTSEIRAPSVLRASDFVAPSFPAELWPPPATTQPPAPPVLNLGREQF